MPLRSGTARVGVLGILPNDARRFTDPGQGQLLDTFTGQIATALERAKLADAAQQAKVQVEAEQLKNSLLSSVSHDLRTPLAVITGSAATLAEDGIDEATRHELLDTIQDESQRLNRLVRNLLDMTRLQAGALHVKKEWQDIEEVIGSALTRLEDRLVGRSVETALEEALPMAPFDGVLLEQVLINLLENALKYTPAGSPLSLSARAVEGAVEVSVADRGPGIAAGELEKIFDKFYRSGSEGHREGVGLGLTICRGIVSAHGGKLWAEPRDGGGAAFRFTIPIIGKPPAVNVEEGQPGMAAREAGAP